MSEDLTRDLKAFTPAGLDRDAVLFAAGRAAARRWAGWKWLTAGLGVSNLVTLGLLFWPKPDVPPPAPVDPTPPAVVEPVPTRPDPSSYIALTWGHESTPLADPGQPAAENPLTPRAINDPRFH